MSLKNKAIKGIAWSTFQRFGFQAVNFIVQIILARILVPDDFGMIAMLQIFLSIGNRLMDGGMTSSLIRTPNPNQKDFSTVFFINVFASVLIYVILFILAPYIAQFYDQPLLSSVLRVYTLAFVIRAFVGVQEAIYTKAMKFKEQMFIQLPSVIVGGIAGVSMAYMGYGVWSLVGLNLVQAFLYMIQYWLKSDWRPNLIISKDCFLYHFNFGYKLTLTHILNAVYDNIYSVVIGKFFSAAQLGYYNRAETFQLFPGRNLASALEKVTYPMFSAMQNDDTKLKIAYKKTMQLVIFGMTPIMVISCVIAEPLFRLVLTEKWIAAVPFFQILTIVGILQPIQRYNLSILRVKGRTDLILKITIIRRIILTIIIALTIPMGITAMVIGQSIYTLVSFYWNTYYSGRFIKYSLLEQTKDIFPVLLIGGITGGVVWLGDFFYQSANDFIRIILAFVIGGGVYLLISSIFRISSYSEVRDILYKNIMNNKKIGK